MAFLGSFEYDIFLSYGWAGSRTPEEGDRAWVKAFKELLEDRLKTQLGRAPVIFLDSQAERSGHLGEALELAVENSAFLLFAASPGSCRADSWCQAEVRHFLGRARPLAAKENVLTAEQRVLGIMFEPVPRDQQPPLLRNMGFRHYELFDELESGPPRITRPADLAAPGSSAGLEFERLLKEASERILEAQGILARPQPPTGVTVFVGSSPSNDHNLRFATVLRRELLIRGHRVITDEPVPLEKEDSYRLRLEPAMAAAQISAHILNESAPTVADWKRSPTAWQIRKAVQAGDVSVMSWVDQDAPATDPGALRELEECKAEGSHCFEKQNFENFKAAVLKRADEVARGLASVSLKSTPPAPRVSTEVAATPTDPADTPAAAAETTAETQAPPPEMSEKLVVVAFDNADLDRAARVRDYLSLRGLQTQLALPPGSDAGERRRQNLKYYKEADGVVVYFGGSTDLWVQNTCDDVRDSMNPEGRRALLVGPPPDQPRLKRTVQERKFDCYRTISDEDVAVIDTWLRKLAEQQVAGTAANAAGLGS